MAIIKSDLQEVICDSYLGLSSEIVRNNKSNEGALRTAVNRAYYSVFLTARDRLFGPDGTGLTKTIKKRIAKIFKQQHTWNPQSHEQIIFAISELSTTGTIYPLALSQQIGELQEARVHADYHFTAETLKDIPYGTWSEYADRMVALASQLLPAAKLLPPYKQP